MFKKEKIKYFDAIVAVVIAFIVIQLLLNYKVIFFIVGKAIKIIMPFILAFLIAYILNPMVSFLEKRFKFNRSFSILTTYAFIIGLIIIFFTLLLPTIFGNVMELFKNAPAYTNKAYLWINNYIEENNLSKIVSSTGFLKDNMGKFVNSFSATAVGWLNSAMAGAVSFASSLIKLIFGLIIAIYVLYDKEKFLKGSRKITIIIFKEKYGKIILTLIKNVNDKICLYLGIKAIDSLIIGIISFFGLLIIGSPYVILIALIVGITNMIPYFGPAMGIIPAVLINVMVDPQKALIVLLFLVLLQQFDAWFLEPKLVGGKVGLSPFLIVLGITIGGSLFGVIGMLLASPIMAVLKEYLMKWYSRYVDTKTTEKSPTE